MGGDRCFGNFANEDPPSLEKKLHEIHCAGWNESRQSIDHRIMPLKAKRMSNYDFNIEIATIRITCPSSTVRFKIFAPTKRLSSLPRRAARQIDKSSRSSCHPKLLAMANSPQRFGKFWLVDTRKHRHRFHHNLCSVHHPTSQNIGTFIVIIADALGRRIPGCRELTQANQRHSPGSSTTSQPPKRNAVHKQTIYRYAQAPSPLVLRHDPYLNKVVIGAGNPSASEQSILAVSCNAIVSYFSQARVSPNRLLYIAISRIFDHQSPRPFGGKKSQPGYADYNGWSAHSLLEYTMTICFKWYWGYRGPVALQFVVEAVNNALVLHLEGNHGHLNELTLKGMKRAGHIDWCKAAMLPLELQDVPDVAESSAVPEVLFTPRRIQLENIKGGISVDG
ncbi:hypothetical protein BC830DRAFT_1080312 [Chytriomyces sp. MP71]|nr:hypothetical protein BC830DRAFT_1080312 [Chytriomyces sp. MP71]